ncbi:alpha/beta hydrolase [Conexibacter stalactiti]|uniref:Alpha/beta hydrolase n=1 Tax=Conexibacter stalactiti TaxID=1940611 RepID=A0ABU4HRC7_9ACTN|nr:alpha/beta hydrolase [Conexibacter stalactiti]MDW5594604.1 alpha/beta hydrolase [Conexibacter stalactiti]MEC5035246.1 alpha/beta hydrolase [Conexibacter stalactiti]
MSLRSRGVAALLGTAAVALVPAAPAVAARPLAGAAQLSARRCTPRGVTRCGRVVVPLDRSGAIPGQVSLRVRMLDGPRRTRDSGTVIALAGGPGQAAAPLLEQIAESIGPALATRRIVTFDQRGTGGSGRLRCPELARIRRASQLDAAVAGCARRLGARRNAYTTAASVEDLEAVRSTLGVDRVALYAVSYGTKVALDYAARYPQRVSRLVLDSVVPQSGNDPFQRATISAIPRILDTLCGHRGCPFTRDATADLATLVRRAARAPLRGRWFDGRGRGHSATLGSEDLFSLLLAGDFDPFQRSALPAALRSAAQGDTAPLLALAVGSSLNGGGSAGGDSDALYIATTCADGGVPWPAGTPVAQRPAAAEAALAALPEAQLAPFDRRTLRRLRIDSCRAWPESPIEQPTAPLPDVPTLILSGDSDLRTPRSDARAVAGQLPRARLLTVPGVGHSVLGAAASLDQRCARRAVTAFFADRRVADCGRTSLPPVAKQAPRRLADLPVRHGLPARAGRTYAAFELTIADAFERIMTVALSGAAEPSGGAVGIGGLRGGTVRIGRRLMRFDRFSFVPGVTVSGVLSLDLDDEAPLVFHIGGSAAARGTLVAGERSVTGTLGGHRVNITGAGASASGATVARATADAAPQLSLERRIGELRTALEQARPAAVQPPAAPVGAAGPLLPGLGAER